MSAGNAAAAAGIAAFLVIQLLSSYEVVGSVANPNYVEFSVEERLRLKHQVVEMFDHAFGSYMDYAFPADELMPLSCRGRYRDSTSSGRGDIDDVLANYTLTLVDSLDTLYIMKKYTMFETSIQNVIHHVNFDKDVNVSVFELTIRALGGLLSAHIFAEKLKHDSKGQYLSWYDKELLDLSTDLADRLLLSFNTITGIPTARINLKRGLIPKQAPRTTCTACAGSMILEFGALTRISGDAKYEDAAKRCLDVIWKQRNKFTNLVGQVVNVDTGEWTLADSTIGAGSDSYYEYLLKGYILLGDERLLQRFDAHYQSIQKHMMSHNHLPLQVEMHNPKSVARNYVDSLSAFWPGLQTLIGDLQPAIRMHEIFYQLIKKYRFLPEAFTTDFRVHWGHNPLRPEFVESTYFLYRVTHDEYYLQAGRDVLQTLNETARVKCGFAGIHDVTKLTLSDQMDSYLLAETFKYLYLLFSDEAADVPIDLQKYIFTTEGHLLPLSLSSTSKNLANHVGGCENIAAKQNSTLAFWAGSIRSPLKNMVEKIRPKSARTSSINRKSKLKPQELKLSNKEHIAALQSMGIRLMSGSSGTIHLVHSINDADNDELAAEGELFIKEIMALQQTVKEEPVARAITIMSYPHCGNTTFLAGPAQFGAEFDEHEIIELGSGAEIVKAKPHEACSPLVNDVQAKLVFAIRGNCLFAEKARNIQRAGGAGTIIIDNFATSTSGDLSFFLLSSDGKTDITIPAVFLYRKEADELIRLSDSSIGKDKDSVPFLVALHHPNAMIEQMHASSFSNTCIASYIPEYDHDYDQSCKVMRNNVFAEYLATEIDNEVCGLSEDES